jgi:Histidine phosphatase superfamily (branch 2)
MTPNNRRPFFVYAILIVALSSMLRISTFLPKSRRHIWSATSVLASPNPSATGQTQRKTLRRVQVQIVHRHGDRTPITPLKDELFWSQQLISPVTQERIATNTKLIEPGNADSRHVANGRGAFGKLTELGLLQMVKLGGQLKEQLEGSENEQTIDPPSELPLFPFIFHEDRPLSARNIRVLSTNFHRTIQSVQGLLVGLFPDSTNDQIEIDVRNTEWMIPDPNPRRTVEQARLEKEFSQQLRPLAIRVTAALHDMLAADAREANFGVPQGQAMLDGESSIEVEPLSWNQLAEITKCLAVRDMLPQGISKDDQELILQHTAWRWFQTFSNHRLARLAMGTMADKIIASMVDHANEPAMTIWSAHDSTLICLLCAFQLYQPAMWPEYGSYFMVELFEVVGDDELLVRFSLNGHALKCRLCDGREPSTMVRLSVLGVKLKELGESHLVTTVQ